MISGLLIFLSAWFSLGMHLGAFLIIFKIENPYCVRTNAETVRTLVFYSCLGLVGWACLLLYLVGTSLDRLYVSLGISKWMNKEREPAC